MLMCVHVCVGVLVWVFLSMCIYMHNYRYLSLCVCIWNISIFPVQCTECDFGKYCMTPGLTAPEGDCEAGYYCHSGSKTPTPSDGVTGDVCPQGRYCPPGTYNGRFTHTQGAASGWTMSRGPNGPGGTQPKWTQKTTVGLRALTVPCPWAPRVQVAPNQNEPKKQPLVWGPSLFLVHGPPRVQVAPNQNEPKNQPLVWGPLTVPCPWARGSRWPPTKMNPKTTVCLRAHCSLSMGPKGPGGTQPKWTQKQLFVWGLTVPCPWAPRVQVAPNQNEPKKQLLVWGLTVPCPWAPRVQVAPNQNEPKNNCLFEGSLFLVHGPQGSRWHPTKMNPKTTVCLRAHCSLSMGPKGPGGTQPKWTQKTTVGLRAHCSLSMGPKGLACALVHGVKYWSFCLGQ